MAQQPLHRNLFQAAVAIKLERGLQCGNRHLVHPNRAVERVSRDLFHPSAFAENHPGLRPAQQLVPGKTEQIHARGDRLGDNGLSLQILERNQSARAEILEDRQRCSLAQRCQLGGGDLLGETDDREIGLMDLQEKPSLGRDGRFIVGKAGAVGRSDFDDPRTGLTHHIRDPETSSDFNQFPARNNHFATLGDRGQGQENRGRIVIDDHRGLGTGELREQTDQRRVSATALSLFHVVLEIGIAGRNFQDPVRSRSGERSATEIRMQHDSGAVEDSAQAGGTHFLEGLDHVLLIEAALLAPEQTMAGSFHRAAQDRHFSRSRLIREQMLQRGLRQKRVDRWKRPQKRAFLCAITHGTSHPSTSLGWFPSAA